MIYLDYAATSPPAPEAIDALTDGMRSCWHNPSALYSSASAAKRLIFEAERIAAGVFNADASELFFTSGGTESNNWAVKCGAINGGRKRVIVSAIEHHSVLNSAMALRESGFEVTKVAPDKDGVISAEAVKSALGKDTALVCVQLANNETGVLQPVREIASAAKQAGARCFCDAVQAAGHIKVDAKALGVDLLSASAHKLGGPKGCGLLYVKNGTDIQPFHHGGGQQSGLRAGTLDAPAIAGFGAALALDTDEARVTELREYFENTLTRLLPYAVINGKNAKRLPGIISLTLPGTDAEALTMALSGRGVCVSPGAACAAGDKSPSHVLSAMGIKAPLARRTVRLSIGRYTQKDELERAAYIIKEEAGRLACVKFAGKSL